MAKGLPYSTKNTVFKQPAGFAVATIPINALSLTLADGAPGFGTAVVGDLPTGDILYFGAVMYLKFTNIGSNVTATFDGDYSLGTTPTADGTLAATEVDLIPQTAFDAAAVDSVTAVMRSAASTASFAGPVIFNNRDGSLELNLNVIIDDAAINGVGTLRTDGVLYIAYAKLGDD